MIFVFSLGNKNFQWDSNRYFDISIPLDFNGKQPSAFKVSRASAIPYQSGNTIGDTRKGGACNFEEIRLVPHCNGTHTECIGHLTDQRIHINQELKDVMIPATVITIDSSINITQLGKEISRSQIESGLKGNPPGFDQALILRTSPNEITKIGRDYSDSPSPYISRGAMSLLNELEIQHLLVDFASVDPANDQGRLLAHRIFWNLPEKGHMAGGASFHNKTITELIYVPEEVIDGSYLLNLQIASFGSDACPSRPVLFPIKEK